MRQRCPVVARRLEMTEDFRPHGSKIIAIREPGVALDDEVPPAAATNDISKQAGDGSAM